MRISANTCFSCRAIPTRSRYRQIYPLMTSEKISVTSSPAAIRGFTGLRMVLIALAVTSVTLLLQFVLTEHFKGFRGVSLIRTNTVLEAIKRRGSGDVMD